MGFHGRKTNGGIILRDRRLAARWERTQQRKKEKGLNAMISNPERGETAADQPYQEIARLRAAMQEACDLLAERKHGSPARSAGHNARLLLEAALNLRPLNHQPKTQEK